MSGITNNIDTHGWPILLCQFGLKKEKVDAAPHRLQLDLRLALGAYIWALGSEEFDRGTARQKLKNVCEMIY